MPGRCSRGICLAGGSCHVGKPAAAATSSHSSASSVVARVDRRAGGGSRDRDRHRSNLLLADDAGVPLCVDAGVASGAAADPRRRGRGAEQACPRRDGVCVRPSRCLARGGGGRRHEHVHADAGGRADAAGEREQDLHGDADPAACPGREASRRRHGRQVAAGAAPLRQPDHDPRAADDEQRTDRQQRLQQRNRCREAHVPRPRQGREAAGTAARDRVPRQRESGRESLRHLVDPVGRLATAPVPARRRVPLLEHRLRHPRPDRRPRGRQALARALPRADLRAARPPRNRLRPARPDQRTPRPRLRDRARRRRRSTRPTGTGASPPRAASSPTPRTPPPSSRP